MSQTELSIVIPLYNEAESLPELQSRILAAMEAIGKSFEVIYCDDGSSDESRQIISAWAKKDDRVKLISFRRNFGQTAALDAGFRHSKGEIVVPMDADLQNDPRDIPILLAEIEKGHDVVKGWRKERKDPFWSRTLPSRIANWVISTSTGVKLHDYGCTLAAYKREILQEIRLYGEMHRFIPAYAVWAGGTMKEVEVRHHPRKRGETSYDLFRTFRVILDLLTVRFLIGYHSKPLYYFGKLGGAFLLLSIASCSWSIVKRLLWDQPMFTDPFFYGTIFLGLAALQMILFGLLAELNMRTYYESQDKPAYVVRTKLNIEG